MIIFKYLSFGIATAFLSWIFGRIFYTLLLKTGYLNKLSNLNFIERKGFNKALGIKYFKWLVENTFFKFFNQKINFKNKEATLSEIRSEMLLAEIGHLIAFLVVIPVAIYKSITENYWFGLVIMIVNILMNLYPSLLQQENKRRIDRLMRREESKAKKYEV